jgi:hypothetical protein
MNRFLVLGMVVLNNSLRKAFVDSLSPLVESLFEFIYYNNLELAAAAILLRSNMDVQMIDHNKKTFVIAVISVIALFVVACNRNNIEFGSLPDGNYTNLVYIDTVEARLSTVLLDSFATNQPNSFLVGKYHDPFLGIISTKPFFQLTIPSEVSIPSTSQYDSLCFIIHLNKYYYGDTSRQQTILVNELSHAIDYSYNDKLYNTSNIPSKRLPLGTKTIKIHPNIDDSLIIRLNDDKGLELFNKLKEQSADITSDNDFQNYFKGVSISTSNSDTTAVYGLNGSAGSMLMRIYYHTTIPFPEPGFIDFLSKANSYAFNQIIADRTGTALYTTPAGLKQFPSEQTNDMGFAQEKTGVLLKIIFPSLKGIISTDKIVRLQKAELIVKPIGNSYNRYNLPSRIYLAKTDGSNAIKSVVLDSTLTADQIVSPVIDNLYGLNTYYRFNITYDINNMLNNTGTEDQGFYILQETDRLQIDRIIAGNGRQSLYKTQLLLTVITINN